ncbi:DUF4135 domain-containing protein [Streptomyces sp. B6B3]|uniref:DUF4135 domain-containing protein n=1 Tax=Streptomyces sp. B6B3 TaxID=3153570 RepID=UPI00325E898D
MRNGSAPGLLPPFGVLGPENTLMTGGEPCGPADARLIAGALAGRRFAPLAALVERLDSWCRSNGPGCAGVLAPGVLEVTNGELFGPLFGEILLACAAGSEDEARRLAALRVAQCESFLGVFLQRLQTDGPDLGIRGAVTRLWAHGEETHNGGQRVLCLERADGTRLAYKPRPASGELLLLAEGGVFDLLNRLAPASGQVRLPVLPAWRGKGDAGYLWQEWVTPPSRHQGVLREEDGWRMTGTVLPEPDAERFWRRAGELTAVCYALGAADLHADNVVVGWRDGEPEPLLYPIDLETYFADVPRLPTTGLTYHPLASGGHHHPGLESGARWCSLAAVPCHWRRGPAGTLELWRTEQAVGRVAAPSLVADARGRTGYGPHLPAMLRGMFDAWTLLCRHRDTVVRFVEERRNAHHVRVILRRTADYCAALRGAGELETFGADERAQLARGDVPYFFRSAAGGGLLSVGEEPPARRSAMPEEEYWPPATPVVSGARWRLEGLGVALRDAVEHVFDEAPAAESAGVSIDVGAPGEGQVAFAWPERDRRVVYRWEGSRARMRVAELSAPLAPPATGPAAEVRRRLLRLDRVDAALRAPWRAGGFADAALEEKLHRLTDAGLVWLRTVVDRHGWPGRALVGERAAAVACRLVQHARGEVAFRTSCLELIRRAAEAGDMPPREIAYVTDALRLAEERPQLYGTKFERVGDLLRPCPIEDPERVDERRAGLGLEPLARYARRVRETFPLSSPVEETS